MEENATGLTDCELERLVPWEPVHRQTLMTVSDRLDLRDPLVSEDAIRTLPDGFLFAWDVSGYTSTLERLPAGEQILFARRIIQEAVRLSVDHRLLMLEPVAGDQALYFLDQSREGEVGSIIDRLRTLRIEVPGGRSLPVKSVMVPVRRNAVFVGSFLDHQPEAGVRRGYSAVMGPGPLAVMKTLKNMGGDDLYIRNTSVPGLAHKRFPVFDEALPSSSDLSDAILPVLTQPCFPVDPYVHAVLHAQGRVDLNDPMHSATLAGALFASIKNDPSFVPLKQNDGLLHAAVPLNESAEPRLAEILYRINRNLRGEGISVRGHWDAVPEPLAVSWGTHMREGVGHPIARIVHHAKGKGAFSVYSRLAM